jgi:AraC-like DNA-binding protein
MHYFPRHDGLYSCFFLAPARIPCYAGFMAVIQKADGFENECLFVLPDEFLGRVAGNKLFQPLTVTDMGYFPSARYHFRQRPRGCETAILIYCGAGSGFYSMNGGRRETLRARELVIIPPNTPHSYGASEKNPWSIYWAHFKGSLVDPYCAMLRGPVPVALSDVFGEKLREIFRQCFTLLKTPFQTEEYFYLCQMVGVMIALAPCAGRNSMPRFHSGGGKIEKAVAYMEKHLRGMVSLDELAEAAGCGRSHLNCLFQKTSGRSPVAYFLRTKMQSASRDLYFSSLPVKDIALSYGIEDPYYFSRLFKKIMGVSPLKYRSQTKG